MAVADTPPLVVPDPGDELVSLSVFPFLPRQHRAAEVRQQIEFLLQPEGAEQGDVFHRLHIFIYFICNHSHLMVQFAGLLIFASGGQQEDGAGR